VKENVILFLVLTCYSSPRLIASFAMSDWEEFRLSHAEFANVRIDAIQAMASSSRDGMKCTVSEKVLSGSENVAFKVVFADNVEWVCRIHRDAADTAPVYNVAKVESTVATMRYIKCNSTIPVPTIYAYKSRDVSPGLGTGYIMMEFLYGQEVDMSPSSLSSSEETQVYHQLANVVRKLSQLRFPKIGRIFETSEGVFDIGPFVDRQGVSHGPFDTSAEYFKFEAESIRAKHNRWLYGRPANATEDDVMRSQIVCGLYDQLASQLSDYDSPGAFPLSHGDLGTHNLLFSRDEAGRLLLTGVVDWDFAHASSWCDFGQWPALLEIRWPTLEAGRYSEFVLESIRRKQRIFLDGIRNQRRNDSNEDNKDGSKFPQLLDVIDTPPVRMAEFLLNYSDPYYRVDEDLLLKYVKQWKKDWNCRGAHNKI